MAALLLSPARSPAAPASSMTPAVKSGSLTAGGGLPAIGARIDFASKRLFVRGCAALPCDAAGGPGSEVAIELADTLDPSKTRFDATAVGAGRQAMRVVAPSASRPGVAWEALVVGAPDGSARVLWASGTGFGATGEASGGRVVVEGSTLYVGKLRRELTLCGHDETLLEPRRLDPKTLQLHRVAMHRLPSSVRSAAPTIVAERADAAPIGSVLTVRGASVNDGASTALTDDDESTVWHETLKGDGKGEFVVFAAPKAIPIEHFSLALHPKPAMAGFDHPVSLWITVDDATFRVAIPPDPTLTRVDVPLPKPISTSCVAVSIDRGEGADRKIGFVEIDGVPVIPKSVHSLDDLVTLLDVPGKDGDLAQTLLSNAGARGAEAIARKLASVAEAGKARAVDVLEATPCAAAAGPLATLTWDAPKPVTRRAREALDACGAAAAPAIAAAWSKGPDAAREILAERWAKLDPKGALPAILDQVRTAPATRRHTYRAALARVPRSEAGREAIAAWLTSAPAQPAAPTENDAVVELARAIAEAPEIAPLVPALSKTLLAHAAGDRPFAARWLAARPIADLAARGDTASLAWIRALHKSPDRYLRARAVEVSGEVDALRPEVVAALKDGDPRVRKAAVVALRQGAGPSGATSPLIALLHDDAWTFVRVAAAETLGEAKGGGDVDVALGEATKDDLPAVRGAAVRALVTRGGRSQLPAIRKRAFDPRETVDVRAEAIGALGKLCDKASVDDLFDLVKRGSSSDGAHQLALAAIDALGELHPPDLAQRLSAIDQTSLVVKDAVRRALQAAPKCP
ncbi:MAG: HEAT repeat domain-containing protein [Deltaproteobacteria bacterium]|nr:HEAT repeat domain-containing protein [Deltaproteobacteria bacterium]